MVALAVAGVAVWGVSLRLADPMSTDVIPAEDPYTHLALTREHLRDGSIDGLNSAEETPYPPGLHAALAVYAVHSGVDLEDIVRFGPVAFGALTVVGVAYALWRLDGPAASIVGALAAAVTPELIFRSQMMAPTALDLALLPFTLLALVQVARGRLGWALPAAFLLAFFVAAHPWVFGILALAGAAFLALALAFPWAQRPGLDARGLAAALLLLGGSSALAISGCWGLCGPGFEVVEEGSAQRFDAAATAILVVCAAVAGGLLLGRRALQRGLGMLRPVGPAVGVLAAVALVAGAAATLWRAGANGFPSQVVPEYMVGVPLIVVAAIGVAGLPWARRPGAHLAVALVAATLPFTVFDPFDSPFWPHRTAAYLAIGLALAAGIAAGAVSRLLRVIAASLPATRTTSPAWRAFVPGLLVASILGASLVSAAPPQYPGWYRLHDECEQDALRDIAALADDDPSLVVVTGSWQSKLVVASMASGAGRIWYVHDVLSGTRQDALAKFSEDTDKPVLIVAERRALERADPFLPQTPAWQPAGSWACGTPVTAHLHTPT